eukprot:scaffold124660_cov21-Tisochrysis_lutea.AAC.2
MACLCALQNDFTGSSHGGTAHHGVLQVAPYEAQACRLLIPLFDCIVWRMLQFSQMALACIRPAA